MDLHSLQMWGQSGVSSSRADASVLGTSAVWNLNHPSQDPPLQDALQVAKLAQSSRATAATHTNPHLALVEADHRVPAITLTSCTEALGKIGRRCHIRRRTRRDSHLDQRRGGGAEGCVLSKLKRGGIKAPHCSPPSAYWKWWAMPTTPFHKQMAGCHPSVASVAIC